MHGLQADNETTVESRAAARSFGAVALVFVSAGELQKVNLREGESVRVGRVAPADVLVSHPSVSRAHARFWLERGTVHVEDDGSKNGIFVNGDIVSAAAVSPGDRIHLGEVEVFVLESGPASDGHALLLSPRRMVVRVDEELERVRYSGRAAHLVALQHDATEGDAGWLPRVLSELRAIDRACEYAPNLLIALLVDVDAAGAQVTMERLRRSARGLSAAVFVAAPPGPMNGEALIANAVDMARRADPRAQAQLRNATQQALPPPEPIVVSPVMRRLFDLASRTGHADLPLCIFGETGAGKEVVARAFHERSRRAKGPFCEVNCAAIAANLVESILFGHEKGAFTGADRRTAGLFEQAAGGTLFLDEVGELSSATQRALLRVLESKRVTRVGGSQELAVDTRIIAATHRDLHALVKKGEFREDLLYRLEGLTVRVPPLRDRPEEIAPLAEQFLRMNNARWSASARSISPAAHAALRAYAWPGNVRQLRNAIERATALCSSEVIEVDDLPEYLFESLEPQPRAKEIAVG